MYSSNLLGGTAGLVNLTFSLLILLNSFLKSLTYSSNLIPLGGTVTVVNLIFSLLKLSSVLLIILLLKENLSSNLIRLAGGLAGKGLITKGK